MSTSRSDGNGSGNGSKSGIGSMFKRAVAAHIANAESTEAPPLREGIEQIVCAHCGAPRHDEERICRFCKHAV
jgi:hypothetical protein